MEGNHPQGNQNQAVRRVRRRNNITNVQNKELLFFFNVHTCAHTYMT